MIVLLRAEWVVDAVRPGAAAVPEYVYGAALLMYDEAPNPHNFRHINYMTGNGVKGTIEIQ